MRQFAHVPGNWPTLVYIPVERSEQLRRWVTAVVDCANAPPHAAPPAAGPAPAAAPGPAWRAVADSDSGVGAGHISLSRSFPLRYPQIALFTETLADHAARYSAAGPSATFGMRLGRLKLFTNEDRTRSFLSLCPEPADNARLERLIREVVDPACEAAEAPTFYRTAEPHLSVAWALGDRTGGALTAEALQRSVEERLRAGGAEAGAAAADAGGSGETAAGGSAAVVVAVRGFESRSGNRVSTFPL